MASDTALSGPPSPVRLTNLPPAAAAVVLSRSGQQPVTEAAIQEDLAAGAPSNPDGTINLIHYAAWLVQVLDGAAPRLSVKDFSSHGY